MTDNVRERKIWLIDLGLDKLLRIKYTELNRTVKI